MKITIHVTQLDIDRGICGDPEQCMVVLAVHRYLRGKWMVGTEITRTDVKRGSPRFVGLIDLPAAVLRKMSAWDQGVRVRPFAFELDVPEHVVRKRMVAV